MCRGRKAEKSAKFRVLDNVPERSAKTSTDSLSHFNRIADYDTEKSIRPQHTSHYVLYSKT